jgi:hypothetical protein
MYDTKYTICDFFDYNGEKKPLASYQVAVCAIKVAITVYVCGPKNWLSVYLVG